MATEDQEATYYQWDDYKKPIQEQQWHKAAMRQVRLEQWERDRPRRIEENLARLQAEVAELKDMIRTLTVSPAPAP